MGLNIEQVFAANPTTTIGNSDLLYVGQSPFGDADDAAINGANLVTTISQKLPNNLFPNTYVSNSGTNNSIASVNFPTTNIAAAEILLPNAVIFTADTFSLSNFATYPVAWIGAGRTETKYTCVTLTLNGSQWFATTNPKKIIKGMTINASAAITFTPSSGYKNNSSYIFEDFISGTAINLSLATNALFNNTSIPGLNITDIVNVEINGDDEITTLDFTAQTLVTLGHTATISVHNCPNLTEIIIADEQNTTITLNVTGCPNLTTLNSSVEAGTYNYTFDQVSYPATKILSGGEVVSNLGLHGVYIPTGATNDYVLTSDAKGNATWKPGGGGSAASYYIYSLVGTQTMNGIGSQQQVVFDTTNFESPAGDITNNGDGSFTTNNTGVYLVTYSLSMTSDVSTSLGGAIFNTEFGVLWGQTLSGLDASQVGACSGSGLIQCNAGDELIIVALGTVSNNGKTIGLGGGTVGTCNLSIQRIA